MFLDSYEIPEHFSQNSQSSRYFHHNNLIFRLA